MATRRHEEYRPGTGDPAARLIATTDEPIADADANADAVAAKLDDPTVQQRLRAIRQRAQEIRAGYTAATNAQKTRMVEDLADGQNDLARILLNVLKEQRSDYSDAGV